MSISATRWGSPLASRRALLIHGLSTSSDSWEGLAQLLVAEGFFVLAPNLLGHAWRRSSNYHVSALAEDLRPYFAMDMFYDVIIGHSLGAIVALVLLPPLKMKPTTVILVDPVLELSDKKLRMHEELFIREMTKTKTVDQFMANNPTWSRRDCMLRMMGLFMCDGGVIKDVARHNKPWSFGGLFAHIPVDVKIMAVIADTKFGGVCRLEDFPRNVKNLNIRALTGIGHCIQFECPEAIMDAILLPKGKL